MATLHLTTTPASFEHIFANRQRAVVMARVPGAMAGNLAEFFDGKRRCERLITHVDEEFGGVLEGLALVSFRPLTKAEKGDAA